MQSLRSKLFPDYTINSFLSQALVSLYSSDLSVLQVINIHELLIYYPTLLFNSFDVSSPKLMVYCMFNLNATLSNVCLNGKKMEQKKTKNKKNM